MESRAVIDIKREVGGRTELLTEESMYSRDRWRQNRLVILQKVIKEIATKAIMADSDTL